MGRGFRSWVPGSFRAPAAAVKEKKKKKTRQNNGK